ncbi:MAG: sensor histidine kinase [Cellulosilyticaceae bacterium]
MLVVIMIGIGIIGGICIARLLSYNTEVKYITEQLQAIQGKDTNQDVRVKAPNKELEALVAAINRSIEEKKETEAKHRHMDKELRQAIANMSHDLRTPLTSVIGYLQMLENPSLSEGERLRYQAVVKSRAQSLEKLIGSFYDLSRIEANEYEIELKSINISTILCELMATFYNDFVDKNLEPQLEIHEKLPAIIADDQATERIFSNLIQNMLKYATHTVKIRHTEEADGKQYTYFINDAQALTEEDVSHLFDRFFTADRMRTGQSTGLGLAITQKLVEQMGHRIDAKLENEQLIIRIIWKTKK